MTLFDTRLNISIWIDPEQPEATAADLSASVGYVAHAPVECVNGCQKRTGDESATVLCQPGAYLCSGKGSCTERLSKWLRAIPTNYALLPHVVEHGTVPSDPGTMHTKRPDPPAPMRLEVSDLLDTRDGRGVLGIVHSWANVIRDDRNLPTPRCHCDHTRPTHAGRCTAIACSCRGYVPGPFNVYAETLLILDHLAWCTGQDWAGDLYQEIRALARSIDDTVGEYRPKPVGSCAALRDLPDSTVQVLCGGALVMDREGTGVHCLRCGQRHEANEGLRALGLIVGSMFGETGIEREAS